VLQEDPRPNQKDVIRRLSLACGWTLIAGALVGIAGWQFRIPALRGQFFDTVVAPNTPVLFLLSGMAVVLNARDAARHTKAVKAVGVFVALFASAVFSQYVSDLDLKIDRIFMSHRLSDWPLASPAGRMSITTSVGLMLVGGSLITLRMKSIASEVLSGLAAAVAYFGLLGYAYGVDQFYGRITAVPTIVLLFVLSTGLLCGTARRGLIGIVTDKFSGGMLLRRFLPFFLVGFPLLGWLQLQAQVQGMATVNVATAMFLSLCVALFCTVLILTAFRLSGEEQKRRVMERALIQTEKLAAAGRMAVTISHEINNPLEALTNLIHLSRTSPGPESQRYLEMADEELRRVSQIARQNLAFYRDNEAPEKVRLSGAIQEVVRLFRKNYETRGLAVTTPPDSELTAKACRGELRQMLCNLLTNAIDATAGRGGKIDISIGCDDHSAWIEFADNGPGVPAAIRPHIFDPFFTTKKDVGTGLGLYVTRQLAEKNGGTIALGESETGARFILTLPRAGQGELQMANSAD